LIDRTEKIRLELEDLLQQYDKIDLLSKVSFTISHSKSNKIDIKNDVPGLQFLVGLSLKTKNTQGQTSSFETVEKVIELLEEYFTIFFRGTNDELPFDNKPFSKETQYKKVEPFSQEIAAHFMQIHNLLWQINIEKYEFQHLDMLRGIFCQLDDVFTSKMGFTITDAINVGYMIHESCFMKQSRHIIHTINKQKKIISRQDEDKESVVIKLNLDIDDAMDFYVCDTNHIAKQLSITTQKTKSILKHVSCMFGEQNSKYQTPLDDNLFLYKPVIRISDDKFFCPQPNALVFYLNRVFYHLLEKEKEAQTRNWEKYNMAKKRYLEERIVQYVARLFPRICIINNAAYSYREKEYETDVLVAFDNKMLIFEAKSGIISESAKRGGVKSMERDMKNLISSATTQAQRVRSYVLETKNPVFTNPLGQSLAINEDIKHRIKFYLINVTLESLSAITANLKRLDSFSLFDGEYPWSVDLFHLDIITEILDYPSIFIHYIENRIASQKQSVFFSTDEGVLFSIYLKMGMLQHSDQEINLILVVPDWSEIFDDYYLKHKEKPRIQKEEFVLQLVEFLEKSRDLGYTETTSIILDVHSDVAQTMSKQIQTAIKTAKKKNRVSDFTIISDKPSVGITFMASKDKEKLFEQLFSYCTAKKYQAKRNQWVGISKDITDKENNFTQVIFLDGKWIYDAELEKMSERLPKIKADFL